MLEIELGRRYERLLFASAPISALAIFVFLVAYAATTGGARDVARCYERFAEMVYEQKGTLTEEWSKAQPMTKSPTWGFRYKYELSRLTVDLIPSTCYRTITSELDGRYRADPESIATKLRADAAEIRKEPLVLSGVEVPSFTKLELFGNPVNIETTKLAEALQVVLAPIILLWLGNLYTTRYRETLRIARTRSISEVFPHIINMYPVGRLNEPRRRSWLAYMAPWAVALVYALTRLFLLLVFVAPPLIVYASGVWLLTELEGVFPWLGLAALLSMFTLIIVFLEFMPWHFMKSYPNDISRSGYNIY